LRKTLRGVAAACFTFVAAGAARGEPYQDGLAAEARGDLAAANRLFRDAAGHGDAAAEYNLGRLALRGVGAQLDYAGARGWFEKAAAQGNPGAQFDLGQIYEKGLGTPRDPAEAAAWYLKAATQGYSSAQVSLAQLYAKGEGVPRDEAAAASWLHQAARQGDADAEFGLALMFLDAAQRPADAGRVDQGQVIELMNTVFGPGKWRETGGYRSRAREDQLRAQGAETVPAGTVSRHSLGTPDAPGAYDIVVAGMSPALAAISLRRSHAAFSRLYPEDAHGTQGPHLHVEISRVDRPATALSARSEAAMPSASAEAPMQSAGDRFGFPLATAAQNYDEAVELLGQAAARGSVAATQKLASMKVAGAAERTRFPMPEPRAR
jgi:TPR repeat protein